MPTPAERVAEGARFLDEKQPDWALKTGFDQDMFDFTDPYKCVLGRCYGDYGDGLRALRIDEQESRRLGFNWLTDQRPEDTNLEIKALATAWRREIETRRAA